MLRLVVFVAFLLQGCLAAYKPATTYSSLESLRGQWNISVERTFGDGEFRSVTCDQSSLPAPCLEPALHYKHGDQVRVTFSLPEPTLQTQNELAVTSVSGRLCFSKASATDRAWRRATDRISKDRSCKVTLGTSALNSTTFTWTYAVRDSDPTATLFAQIRARCNTEVPGEWVWCQVDDSTGQTYIAVESYNPITTGMIVAVIIMSIVGPLFLLAYFVADHFINKNK